MTSLTSSKLAATHQTLRFLQIMKMHFCKKSQTPTCSTSCTAVVTKKGHGGFEASRPCLTTVTSSSRWDLFFRDTRHFFTSQSWNWRRPKHIFLGGIFLFGASKISGGQNLADPKAAATKLSFLRHTQASPNWVESRNDGEGLCLCVCVCGNCLPKS